MPRATLLFRPVPAMRSRRAFRYLALRVVDLDAQCLAAHRRDIPAKLRSDMAIKRRNVTAPALVVANRLSLAARGEQQLERCGGRRVADHGRLSRSALEE